MSSGSMGFTAGKQSSKHEIDEKAPQSRNVSTAGRVIDAVISSGFSIRVIISALKKRKDQKAFDHNVDPTLAQSGIPTSPSALSQN